MYFTVGRNPQSNIVITGYDVVSFDHATLEYEGGQWLFIDDSSNGTMVNGQLFHHASCPIKQGDVIMLAGVCPLQWERIAALVPQAAQPQAPINSRPTQMYTPQPEPRQQAPQPQQYQQPQYQPQYQPQQQQYSQPQVQPQAQHSQQQNVASNKDLERNLDKWNWGAFCLGWIWGVFNNAYLMLIGLLPIANLVMAIIGGIKGTRWAWEGGNWKPEDYDRFASRQKGWMIAGLIVLGLSVLSSIMVFSLASTLLGGIFDIFDPFSDFDDDVFFLF